MENTVTGRAKEFLQNVNDEDFRVLVFANEIPSFAEDHIMRRLVKYAYQDFEIELSIGMFALYPMIAQEAYRRFVNVAIKPYQQK